MDDRPTARIRIWDPATRLFHWAMAVLLVVSWISGENEAWEIHALSGYLLAGLLLFRLLWGFAGSRTSRFADFVRGPGAILRYLKGVLQGSTGHWQGHNPAGGAMVALLLLIVTAQVVTGLFASDDILFEGPLRQFAPEGLAKTLTSLHHLLFNLLLALAIVHILAVLLYWIVKRDNLILPMLTGRASWPADGTADRREKHFVPAWLGLAVLIVVTAATALVLDALQPF
ncbi:cytochrome b/b6 domain-containing protein [Marinibaculum pumilum]|uniref:Cytochrome b/b6 domain-containing protein n=1 Tax=Marinibaculum pumilum TaxID=1766165 RepID=A0ABV7KYI2_9PROT